MDKPLVRVEIPVEKAILLEGPNSQRGNEPKRASEDPKLRSDYANLPKASSYGVSYA